ncbi:phosphoenolpyruvate--protein phosphotransferase [Paenibacillus sp. 2TAB23]|uniref:phosphoenolpyruvate--protein phosphotransferase n=1 Tax=Paenibacillus sp. 2TAB23 TaxID=3233004 RepID=UPI003F9E0A26
MMLQGIPASPGYAVGRVRVIRTAIPQKSAISIDPSSIPSELARLDAALSRAEEDLVELHEKWLNSNHEQEAEIFEGHLFLLRDDVLRTSIRDKIQHERLQTESAVIRTVEEIADAMSRIDDPYLQMRSADFYDIGNRINDLLTSSASVVPNLVSEPEILIADDLLPSFVAQLDTTTVSGFATSLGGATSHTAILARSIGLPAIIGGGDSLRHVEDGQWIILDGIEGKIILDPEEDELSHYRVLTEAYHERMNNLKSFLHRPTSTKDGHLVELMANIGLAQEASSAKEEGAEGIGLFRTEFMFMGRNDLPDENEQVQAYCDAVRALEPNTPVVIRTMDIGGDKELPVLNLPKEENPFLGFRAIRISLEKTDMFKTQLRAILRASAIGNISIMFPMISTLQEWHRAVEILEQVKKELSEEGIPYKAAIAVGMMIEVPSAAVMADRFAKHVDFFSIGTNDLVQYTMAADRMNPSVMHMNDHMQPAVLKLINYVIQAAIKENKPVGMCGEMASERLAVPILIGMGLQKFSMNGKSILSVRELISRIDRSEAVELVKTVMQMDETSAIKQHVHNWLKDQGN